MCPPPKVASGGEKSHFFPVATARVAGCPSRRLLYGLPTYMRLLATALSILAFTPVERISAEETGASAPALEKAADLQSSGAATDPVRIADEGHYPVHESGGLAASSADLEQYLKTLQERATARAFLLTFPDVLFEPNSAQLREQGRSDLASMAEFLREHPDTMARIIGHTDDRGEASSNARLAEERAAAVRSFLISQRIAEWRLVSSKGGEEHPPGDNRTPAGRDSNRRVQIFVQKRPTQAP